MRAPMENDVLLRIIFLSMEIVFSELPMSKSAVGFVCLSLYVGVGLMSHQFSKKWYAMGYDDNEKVADYKRRVK